MQESSDIKPSAARVSNAGDSMGYRRALLLCVSVSLLGETSARFEINGHTIDGQAIGGWLSSQQNKLKERMKDLKVQAVKMADTLKPKEQSGQPSEESPSPAASQLPSMPPSTPAQPSRAEAAAAAAGGKSWLPFGLGELVGAVALAALVGLLLDEKRMQTVRSRIREATQAWASDAKPAAPPPADEPPAAPAAITQREAVARPSQEPGLMSYVDVSASAFGGGGGAAGAQDPELMSYVDVSQAGLMDGAAPSQ